MEKTKLKGMATTPRKSCIDKGKIKWSTKAGFTKKTKSLIQLHCELILQKKQITIHNM